jgi:TolA-binding protein
MVKFLTFTVIAILLLLFPGNISFSSAEERQKNSEELSVEEQTHKANEGFEKILEIVESSERKSVLSEIENAYLEIIDKYPKAPITQECYWRLMSVYLTDYDPPRIQKAETLYSDFIKKYPDSVIVNWMKDDLSKNYYEKRQWKKLMAFHAPAVKQYIEKRTLSRPTEMFMYSEAKFNLDDIDEAEKGYKIVISLFPNSMEGLKAKEMLDVIKKRKKGAK